MNGRQIGYGLLCAVALFYLLAANARGYVPFAGPFSRSTGSFGASGGHFIFHK